MIKNIIFDTGGVLINRGKTPMGELLADLLHLPFAQGDKLWQEALPDLLVGNITSGDLLKNWHQQFDSKHSVEIMLERWQKQWNIFDHEINIELLKSLPKLKSQYRLYVLTDTIDLYDPIIEQRVYPFMDKVFRSAEHKLRKPDPNAYLNLCEQSGIKPEESLFIDDKEINVRAAEKIGIKGIVFTNNLEFFPTLETMLA